MIYCLQSWDVAFLFQYSSNFRFQVSVISRVLRGHTDTLAAQLLTCRTWYRLGTLSVYINKQLYSVLANKNCSSFLGKSKHAFMVPSALYMGKLLNALLRITKCATEQERRNSKGDENDDGQAPHRLRRRSSATSRRLESYRRSSFAFVAKARNALGLSRNAKFPKGSAVYLKAKELLNGAKAPELRDQCTILQLLFRCQRPLYVGETFRLKRFT